MESRGGISGAPPSLAWIDSLSSLIQLSCKSSCGNKRRQQRRGNRGGGGGGGSSGKQWRRHPPGGLL